MTYDLAIGDRAYSSWSLRGWLLFDAFGIPVKTHTRAALHRRAAAAADATSSRPGPSPRCARPKAPWCPKALPSPRNWPPATPRPGSGPPTPRPAPRPGCWPPKCTQASRALRSHCPMNLRVSYTDCAPPDAVLADLARLETLWAWARRQTGATGPVALRRLFGGGCLLCAGGRPHRHLQPARRARGRGLCHGPPGASVLPPLARDGHGRRRRSGVLPARLSPPALARPGAAARTRGRRRAVGQRRLPLFRQARHRICWRLDGRIFGFCNAFCRDKTVADPEAWPKFMALMAA